MPKQFTLRKYLPTTINDFSESIEVPAPVPDNRATEAIIGLTDEEGLTLQALARLDVYVTDGFPSTVDGLRIARKRILDVKGVVDTDIKKYKVSKSLLAEYASNMRGFRTTLMTAVKNQVSKYDFKRGSDKFAGDDECADMLAYIKVDGRFMHKNFDVNEPIFTSEFFLTIYSVVYLNKKAHDPRLVFADTCAPSMCLLLCAINHYLSERTADLNNAASSPSPSPSSSLEEDRPAKIRRLHAGMEFKEGCLGEKVYKLLLDETKPMKVKALNAGKSIDWTDAVETFQHRLATVCGPPPVIEEINDEDLIMAAFM
ncbi:hypothetical protein [Absidia glauca]|uniref:Uncharacterized protein n=1 Tax=Absidia glauca TaxID=4829 RepID=A0A163ISZ7_ABSGL|nr:hypothetical protein [Absidia glauca]